MNPLFDPELHAGLIAMVQVASFAYGLLLALYLDDFKDVFRSHFPENKVVMSWFWCIPVIINLALAGTVSWRTYRVAEEIRKASGKIEEASRRRAAIEDSLKLPINAGR